MMNKSQKNFKKVIIALLITFTCIIGIEVFMREYFGFCDTVLIIENPDYEYIAMPNQNRFRFRNTVKYNSFSMRSNEVDSTSIIILGFGDSILNGGVQTNHDSLATSILSDTLSKLYNKNVQFLNISAGSWGPDNCFAYLNKFGNFGANAIYLFVSSHDAYDNMSFQKVVDVNKSFPSKQYKSALFELVDRYLLPRIKTGKKVSLSDTDKLVINKKETNSTFNSGFEAFHNYSVDNNIPLIMHLHADINEFELGYYNNQGQEIIEFATENNIKLIKDLENGLELSDFRDNIHINSKGQKKLAISILKSIE